MVEIEYAFLADAADAPAAAGKLYALGIGIDEIQALKVPVVHAHMVLVLKFKLHPSECDREHRVEIEFTNEDGQRIGPLVSRSFSRGKHLTIPTADVFSQLVMNLHNLPFERAGAYQFNVTVNGEFRKAIPVRLTLRRSSEPPNDP